MTSCAMSFFLSLLDVSVCHSRGWANNEKGGLEWVMCAYTDAMRRKTVKGVGKPETCHTVAAAQGE